MFQNNPKYMYILGFVIIQEPLRKDWEVIEIFQAIFDKQNLITCMKNFSSLNNLLITNWDYKVCLALLDGYYMLIFLLVSRILNLMKFSLHICWEFKYSKKQVIVPSLTIFVLWIISMKHLIGNRKHKAD